MRYEITPKRELYDRIFKFQQQLKANETTGAVITQNTDLFYFSGTIQKSLLFIPNEGEPILAVNGNIERAARESRLKNIVPLKNNHVLDETVNQFGFAIKGKIGLEMDVLPVSFYLTYQSDYKDAQFVDVSGIIRKLRMIKSEYELKWIRMACSIQNEVMDKAKNEIHAGMRELDLDSILTGYARKKGHQGFLRCRGYNQEINYSHILSGKDSALSTYVNGPLGGKGVTPNMSLGAGYNIINENRPIIIDFGIGINGYISDMTRTMAIGKLPLYMEKAYEFAKEVKQFMESWAKPEKSPAKLYEEIIGLVKSKGYENHFMGFGDYRVNFVGHGIGLELDEFPLIAPNFKEEFQPGMVYAFEPKFVFPGKGAVGLEDDFVVTSEGVERLTNFSDDIIRIVN